MPLPPFDLSFEICFDAALPRACLDCTKDQPREGGSGLPRNVARENLGDCGGVVAVLPGLMGPGPRPRPPSARGKIPWRLRSTR